MSLLLARAATQAARRWLIAAAALVAGTACYLVLSLGLLRSAPADASPLMPERAAALVEATSGDKLAANRAVGDQARLINAAMPFSQAPVAAARAFVLPAGESLDQRRALLCLTQAVYYEAAHEPLAGRRAVAQVVLNRMRHPAYPKSVCGVVYQRNSTPVCQFTFVCDGSLDRRPVAGLWREAETIARAALAGYVERSVGSATHYHADYVAPKWAPMLVKLNKLGAHIFYRWPGSWGLPGAFTGRYIGEPRDPASMRPAMVRTIGPDGAVDAVVAEGPITDGTMLKRAPNDVGGLLDTSKGWTLTIPAPSDAGSASRAIAAQQQARPAGPGQAAQNGASAQSHVIASR